MKSLLESGTPLPQRCCQDGEQKLAENQSWVTGKVLEVRGERRVCRIETNAWKNSEQVWGKDWTRAEKDRHRLELKWVEEGKAYSAYGGTQRTPAMTEEAFSLAPVPAGVPAGPLRVSDLYSCPGDSWRCQHCAGLSCTSSMNHEFLHAEAPLWQQAHIILTHQTTFLDLFCCFSSNTEFLRVAPKPGDTAGSIIQHECRRYGGAFMDHLHWNNHSALGFKFSEPQTDM